MRVADLLRDADLLPRVHIAAETLLRRIARPDDDSYPREIVVEPELVVRESTTRAKKLVS